MAKNFSEILTMLLNGHQYTGDESLCLYEWAEKSLHSDFLKLVFWMYFEWLFFYILLLLQISSQGYGGIDKPMRSWVWGATPIDVYIIFSCCKVGMKWNHRVVRVGKDLKDHLVPTHLPLAGWFFTKPGCSGPHPVWHLCCSQLYWVLATLPQRLCFCTEEFKVLKGDWGQENEQRK